MKKLIYLIVKNQTNIRNFIIIILFKLNLIPKEYYGKAKQIYNRKKLDKIFKNSKLSYSENGYYYLNPMPNEKFLNEYYEKTYWQSRSDINFPVRLRDIEHFELIVNFYKGFNLSPKKILNFGAGHGGISFLFHSANHEVYNYDYGSTKKNFFSERWHQINLLDNLNNKFDLIYGSHSLEHVQDLFFVLKKFDKISHPDTIFFFEVPNHFYDNKKIHPPHTYYFTRKFFFNAFNNVDFCKTFLGSEEKNDESGGVIRFFTKSKIKILAL